MQAQSLSTRIAAEQLGGKAQSCLSRRGNVCYPKGRDVKRLGCSPRARQSETRPAGGADRGPLRGLLEGVADHTRSTALQRHGLSRRFATLTFSYPTQDPTNRKHRAAVGGKSLSGPSQRRARIVLFRARSEGQRTRGMGVRQVAAPHPDP